LVDPVIALSSVVLFGALGLALYWTMNVRAQQLGEKSAKLSIQSSQKILEVLESFRESVVRNRRNFYAKEIAKTRHDYSHTLAELQFMPSMSKYVIESGIVIGAVIISGIQFWLQDAAHAVATFSVFLDSGTRIAPAIMRLQQSAISIRANAGNAQSTLDLLDSLKEILSRLRKFEKFSKELTDINEQMDNSLEQLSEVARDYEALADNTEFDEEQLIELREKVEFIHKMLRKHQVTNLSDLMVLKQDLSTALQYGENLNEKIAELELALSKQKTKCLELASQLSVRRKGVLSLIETQLLDNLKELQMENSQFQIELISDDNKLSEKGFDSVEFLFTANAGSPLRELKRAVSGGEMSRFMLAIKSLIAQKIDLATMIFDEIDTGVSGLVANKVATVLDKLSKAHQIIAITHLPQIASRGSHHINVYKSTENKVTTTHLKLLHQADREIEIARMISGETITPASLASARELLG
jgi:DNA repair protein RecN